MNNNIDILKNIYKPYKYTIKGKATILYTTLGNFIIKEKNKDIKKLFTYLENRGFIMYPKLIDTYKDKAYLYEYLDNFNIPNEQKLLDLIDIIASLHNKTSYFKEISIDKYKEVYEAILSNINYLSNYYNNLYDTIFNLDYYSPSEYLFFRNYYLINNTLLYAKDTLDSWYKDIESNLSVRVAIVHNNLKLEHFKDSDIPKLISWDNYLTDTPVIDIVNLYKNEWDNYNFKDVLDKYMYKYPLLSYEEKLLFTLLSIPIKINKTNTELERCIALRKVFDYISKTNTLLEPYKLKDKVE